MAFFDYDEIVELCRNRIPEALQLEFKEKATPDKPELDNADKKVIAKAVSAFANSGGGTLVLGVRTEKHGDLDVASELKPIPNPEVYRSQVEFVCKTNVSPEIAGVEVKALVGPQGKGVVVCTVPASERRPHMSTAPNVHTYFRRTFQGNVPMTPFEVQEQVLAVREAVLKPSVKLSRGASFSNMTDWVAIGFSFEFGIENIGNRACLNPFLRVRSSESATAHSAYFDSRLETWKSNVQYGTIVHVDDALTFFNLNFIARVTSQDLFRAFVKDEGCLLRAARLYDGANDLHSLTITDKVEIDDLSFQVNFGAENAVARTKSYLFKRDDIAARILTYFENNISEMLRGIVNPWRSDLISNLRREYPDELPAVDS